MDDEHYVKHNGEAPKETDLETKDDQVKCTDNVAESDITFEQTINKTTGVDSASEPAEDAVVEILAGNKKLDLECDALDNIENIAGEDDTEFKNDKNIMEATRVDKEIKKTSTNFAEKRNALNAIYLAKSLKKRSIKCLNKMQIMEDVREGCDVVHPPSPGHADDRGVDESQAVKKENINQNGTNSSENEEERCKETVVKEETIDKSDGECEDKNKDTTPVSENHKRKLDEDDTPLKRLKSEIQENFASRDKIFNDFIEITQSNNLEQITVLSEQTLSEIKALNEMAKEKEREWNHLIHLKKLKEELLIRLQRKRQVIVLNDTNLGDIALDGLSQQSVLKSNQKTNILRSSLDKPVQKGNFPKSQFDINSALDFRQKQRPILDVQSIIADYRQKHPESVPRRGGNYSVNQKVSDAPNDMGLLLNTINGSRENSRSSQPDPTFGQDVTSFKDILVQFAKLSQNEKNELQMHLQHVSRPPPPYPEVTVHPVSTTNTVAPTNSLLHGILTNTATKQHHQNNGSSNVPNGNSKTSFSPTLARLLTAPERCGSNHMISTPTISTGGLLQGSNMSISEILSTSKARNEITITPVSGQYESSSKEESIVEEECEEGVDRLVIDESSEVLSCRKDDTSSDAGDDVPQCQGCNQKAAQFVCAGCGNQWYCSRDCQVAAWDEHSEVCSG